jgi:hypothetical protein
MIMDMQEFDKNRTAFPPEELLAYRGQYIAWSPDGNRIIASDKDGLKLDDTVRALGYDPAEVTFSSVPDADRHFIEGPICARENSRDNRGFPSPRTASAILDLSQFNKNRLAFPPEELLQYRGQYIAWSPDGSRIIAGDRDFLKLDDTVKGLGYDPSEVSYETVPDADIILGAGVMGE